MLKKAGIALLILWALVFVGGAVGELFDIEFLRKATDVKSFFLR